MDRKTRKQKAGAKQQKAGAKRARKKPGPVADPNLVVTSVSLNIDQIEWGKKQPGGLSAFLRQLLTEAREKEALEKEDA